jgi:ADP-ribose pyrophosphatase YjhB (NUDIX family)
MFYQKKYGLEKPAYATIGGLFNIGEMAEECATRELLEETGLQAENLVNLGRYRVQVNRGGGFLYAFLAKNCVPAANKKKSDDYESQKVRKLTKKELLDITLKGEVGEAQ